MNFNPINVENPPDVSQKLKKTFYKNQINLENSKK